MHIGGLSESKYLKKEDVGTGKLLTIRELVEDTIQKEEGDEQCFVLYFEEEEKGMVLKPTNANIIARIIGSEETDEWIGHKVVLFNDPNVSFGKKLVGGIRVRAPRQQTAAAPRPVAPPRAAGPPARPVPPRSPARPVATRPAAQPQPPPPEDGPPLEHYDETGAGTEAQDDVPFS